MLANFFDTKSDMVGHKETSLWGFQTRLGCLKTARKCRHIFYQ